MKAIETDYGRVIEIGKTEDIGVSLLIIDPGEEIPAHYHKKTKEYEIIIKGEVWVNGEKQNEDSLFSWEIGEEHEYVNKSDKEAHVICVTIPPYDPEDEIPANSCE